jgi:hypothetical protein
MTHTAGHLAVVVKHLCCRLDSDWLCGEADEKSNQNLRPWTQTLFHRWIEFTTKVVKPGGLKYLEINSSIQSNFMPIIKRYET